MILRAPWQTPPSVRALYTTRCGGVSDSPFHSLNFAANIGDDAGAVAENRMRLSAMLPNSPPWLQQAHTSLVIRAEEIVADATVADAVYTFAADTVCAVLTADCVPVLFCTTDGNGVAAAHAGWRGLSNNILENTAAALRANGGGELYAWIGPAIGAAHYEIGEEVVAALCQHADDESCFRRSGNKWHADLSQLAARRLRDLDIKTTPSELCTYAAPKHFFSARRDNNRCGRMATLIWRQAI